MAIAAHDGAPATVRVAFIGKGGSGKSMIAGTLCRLLAASGEPVLALDSDPLPGLAFSLGVARADTGLPDEATTERADGGQGPRFGLVEPPLAAVERYAVEGPDGLRLLQMGKQSGASGPLVRSQHAFRQIVDGLGDAPYHLVGDLPGGTRQPSFGWARWADLLLVVAEPGSASLLTARRLARLARTGGGQEVAAVASKVEGPEDVERVAERTGLRVLAAVPRDPAVAQAERLGIAPVDHAPASPAVQAVASLLASLRG